jgi:hypothetical protein
MGAMIESLDASVTDILAALEELELLDTTIIIFSSDNGGKIHNEYGGLPPTSNYPLRGGKGSIYEGGTRVPAIIVWPGMIKGGTTSGALTSSIDFYPTILDMAGIGSREGHIVDGISLAENLVTNKPLARDAIFSHFPKYSIPAKNRPATYVIQGDWKYIRFYDSNGPQGYEPKALYHLTEDVGERNNLWKAMPDKVEVMDSLISQHLTTTGALLPIPNPAYTPDVYNPIVETSIDTWAAQCRCSIRKEDGALHATSKGDAPTIYNQQYFNSSNPASISFRVLLRKGSTIRIQASDAASERWDRSWQQDVEVTENNSWQEYSIDVPGFEKIRKLRFSAGEAGTEAVFDWIRVVNTKGEITKAWEFNDS